MVDVSPDALHPVSPRRHAKSPRRGTRKSGHFTESLEEPSESESSESPRSRTPHKKHRHRSASNPPAMVSTSEEDSVSPNGSPRGNDDGRRKYAVRPNRRSFGLSSSTEESSESESVDSTPGSPSTEERQGRREQMHRTREKSKSLEVKPTEDPDGANHVKQAKRFSSNLGTLEENVIQEEEGDKELRKKGMGRQKSLDSGKS